MKKTTLQSQKKHIVLKLKNGQNITPVRVYECYTFIYNSIWFSAEKSVAVTFPFSSRSAAILYSFSNVTNFKIVWFIVDKSVAVIFPFPSKSPVTAIFNSIFYSNQPVQTFKT